MIRPSASELIACFQDTMRFALEGELVRETETAAASSTIYQEGSVSARLYALSETEIRVEEGTSFAVAKRFANSGRVAVLNFANPHYPGGGVANGAMAQEECLCRSSNLYPCLNREPLLTDFYRYHREQTDYFFSDRLIYTRDVTVFKDDGPVPQYLPREECFRVDVITCAAPYLAQRRYTNRAALKQTFKSRIRNILEAAIDNGVDVLILGAFGCGAFKNPPEVVAAAFWEVLAEERYRGAFHNVIFAIKHSEKNPYCPNLAAFEREFYAVAEDTEAQEGILPAIRLPGGRLLETAAEIRQFAQWQERNPYYGKQFSVLGDSISTLDGYNPRGYHVYYQGEIGNKTGVTQMEDTWWGKVIGFFGGELLINNGWSGSTVALHPGQKDVFPSGCSRRRTGTLHIDDVKPDVVLVYMGINDWANGLPLEGDGLQSFGNAYREMLRGIRQNYPKAEIWCYTLSETYMESKPAFRFPSAYGGIEIMRYNQVIAECAGECGCRLVDVHGLREPCDTVDGTHPTAAGMDTLAWSMLAAMGDQMVSELLGKAVAQETGQLPEVAEGLNDCSLRLWLKAENRVLHLQGQRHLVGRSTDCDLQLSSPYAARYQATFIREGAHWFLRDNNSKNGTYVNGIRLEPGETVMLKQGDSISFARKEEAEVM